MSQPSPEGVPGALLDPTAVHDEELQYDGAGGEAVNAFLARPSAPGAHPGLLVIHEAGGLGDHIRDVTRRFANQGYVALGVDLYTREGGPPPAGDLQAIMERLFSIPDARVLGDLRGAADHLRSRADVTGKVGAIGFCMGGRYTLLLACAEDCLDAAVACWGGFIDRATPEETSTPERPTPPLELTARLSCPLMFAVGAEDRNPSPELAADLRERLKATPHETVVDVYDGAGHAFFADYRPSYRPAAAALLWERVVPFFAKHLPANR